MGQLAEALAGFAPELQQFAGVQREREQQELTMEGERRAQELIEADAKSYKQAVDEGLISRASNPWVRLGMKQRFGQVMADRYAQSARAWSQQAVLEGAVDVEDFQEAEAEFRAQWVEENVGQENRDGIFEKVFAARVNNTVAGIGQEFAQKAGQEALERSKDDLYELIMEDVRESDLSGIDFSSPEAANLVIDPTMARIQEMVDVEGMDARELNQVWVDVVTDLAQSEGSLVLLDLVRNNARVGNTRYAVEAINEAEAKIDQQQGVRDRIDNRAADDQAESVYKEAVSQAINDPENFDFDFYAQQLNEVDPSKIPQLAAIQNARLSGEQSYDPETLNNLTIRAAEGRMTRGEATNAAEQGLITGQQMAGLLSMIEQDEGTSPDNKMRANNGWRSGRDIVQGALGAPESFTQDFTEDSEARKQIAVQAMAEYQRLAQTMWIQSGVSEMNPLEQTRAFQDLADQIVENARKTVPSLVPTQNDEQGGNAPQSEEELLEQYKSSGVTGSSALGLVDKALNVAGLDPEVVYRSRLRAATAKARRLFGLPEEEEMEVPEADMPPATSSSAAVPSAPSAPPPTPTGTRAPRGARTPREGATSVPQAFAGNEKAVGLSEKINKVARTHGIPQGLAFALIEMESGFNPKATGPSTKYGRARGLTQVIPPTARAMGVGNPQDLHDPDTGLNAGFKYLKQMYDKFGTWELALAAYHGGPGAVTSGRWKRIGDANMPSRQYVRNILRRAGL